MRLQNTTSCTGKYYAISEQNLFTDLLCDVSSCSLCVCLTSNEPPQKYSVQIRPQLLEGFFNVNGIEKKVENGKYFLFGNRVAKVEHNTAGAGKSNHLIRPSVSHAQVLFVAFKEHILPCVFGIRFLLRSNVPWKKGSFSFGGSSPAAIPFHISWDDKTDC